MFWRFDPIFLRESESRYSDLVTVNGYEDGSKILTITGEGTQASYGVFSLPQSAPSGQCLDHAPIRYLRDSLSTCTRTLTVATCADFTAFSARAYLQSSALFNPACPRSFRVSTFGSDTGDVEVPTEVNYFCTNDVTGYVKSTTRYSDLFDRQTIYSLAVGLEGENCSNVCQTPACSAFNAGKGESDSKPLPARCSFDNSFQTPPVPSYDSNTGICSNVVLEVRYQITWTGAENPLIKGGVVSITGHVVMGDVSLANGDASVSQTFNATFVHNYTGSSNQTDNYQGLTTPYTRSGRPGQTPPHYHSLCHQLG